MSTNMKWEEEKSKIQYNEELKTLTQFLRLLIQLNQNLYDINSGRSQYHRE
jgi:hypothetical protein